MVRKILRTGAIFGAISVLLGAFAAHGLKAIVAEQQLAIFQTGVRYQFYHTLAILAVGLVMLHQNSVYLKYAYWTFVVGILLFSGSLYLLSTRFALGIESWTWLGPLTPLGGLFFVSGWILFFIGLGRLNK